MKLSERVSGEFSATARERGEKYFARGRVDIGSEGAGLVYATVEGTQFHEVSLELDGGALLASCDCPHFDSGVPCKHLWAAILAAERRGLLPVANPAADIDLILDLDIDYLEPGDEEYGEDFRLLSPSRPAAPAPPPPPQWKERLSEISGLSLLDASPAGRWPAKREILYIIDADASRYRDGLLLRLMARNRNAQGAPLRTHSLSLERNMIPHLPLEEDREAVSALAGAVQHHWGYAQTNERLPESWHIGQPLAGAIVPVLVRTGRCYLSMNMSIAADDLIPLSWDDGDTWRFHLEMRRSGNRWKLGGSLRRGAERMELEAASLISKAGFVFAAGRAARLDERTPFHWIYAIEGPDAIEAAEEDRDEFLQALLCAPNLPPLETPEELRYEEVSIQPRPGVRFVAPEARTGSTKLRAELWFDYEGQTASAADPARGFFDAAARRFLRRDETAEKAAADFLSELGLRYRAGSYYDPPEWELAPTKLPRVVGALVQAGWHVEAEGKIFRRPGSFHIEVSTGIDWFELHGGVDYGETSANLPELLEALRRGENMVRLGDGTYGVVPEEWLRKIGLLAGAGTPEDGHLRFRPSQAGLLDALVATQPEARCDEAFDRLRRELKQFQGIAPARQPGGFAGSLRDYQREGLGWMEFLRRFSFGGCLADDMGVGKTAQVLALLETRRERREAGDALGPSLVVVPRSLVFNWKQEAERFTPRLRVLDYTGSARGGNGFSDYDVVLTTYGTLRRDAVQMKDVEFDYVVLDEAQAVKNAATASAKAVRLLRARHRLALSGTPVENHLGELWSLFEFLNPGMLGAAGVFKLATGVQRSPDGDTRRLLAHALRPFILRRTKQQVARELPPKAEQTVYCDMEPAQRRVYNELRQHYRNALLKRIDSEGLAKSKIQVLEALLRLRQAACHPGLLDPKRRDEPSAKLEVLLEQLRQVVEEGHKALVFSQFTSLLAIVRERLDSAGLVYEYLDGQTRDRQARVERFQNDPDCPLFLISLKAGGLGLNLTAAEYVFLLDPWWNPAVEAQAVDRAHRIGQTRQVFAYRLIARDTVEEKVLELQKNKRDLAAAIIGEENSLIRDLRREDLELLLS
jgi:superfamily II DNA or RNA helicase